MEVILAKTAGFCFGVKRAVDTVYKEAGKKNVYTYGPIIHNSEVVNDLKKKGVEVINSREELEALEEGTVIIRSHGVAREIYDLIHEKGLELVDATCPFVRKIHKIVRLVHRIIPAFSRDQMFPVLGEEFPVHARRHIGRDHGRLNGKRAAAAEGIHQDPSRIPGSQFDQCSSQILRNGGFCRQLTISSLM